MNTTNLMRDPFYVPILARIETRIAEADREAVQEGVPLTDSQVRSILNRVRKSAKIPDMDAGSRRDQILAKLQSDLTALGLALGLRDKSGQEMILPEKDWHLSLRCVEDSIKLRSSGPGSREYLEYIAAFVGQVRKAQ